MNRTAHRLIFTCGRVVRRGLWRIGLSVSMLACLVSACAPKADDPTPNADAQSAQVGYLQAPRVTATTLSERSFRVKGTAAKGARIRLSSPEGQAFGTTADDGGGWQIDLPRPKGSAQQAMLFGLSEDIEGRIIQAEFYVAFMPDPQVPVVLLRAGTGAQTLAHGTGLVITTADYDGAGGLTVSGFAPVGQAIKGSVNGAEAVESWVGQDGRFTIGLTGPSRMGTGQVTIASGNLRQSLALDISSHKLPSGTLADMTRQADGWRIDWTTPSGGVQTTYIQSPAAGVTQ